MSKPTVFVSAPIHPAGLDLLRKHAEVLEVHHPTAAPEELAAALSKADAVIIRSMPLGAGLLAQAPRLKVIAKHGAGMDSIDVAAATRLGIVAANSGDANSMSVAEHAVALMMAVLHRVNEVHKVVLSGGYQQRERLVIGDLWESTVGLVGFGNIGRYTAQMCGEGFDAGVLAFDPMVPEATMQQHGAVKVKELDALIARSDIISLHLPLTETTRHLIGERELRLMKTNAILVNTSRGGIVDEAALAAALREKTIRGAGIDVFEQEPPAQDNPLFSLDNVVLSPHIGGGTEAARRRASLRAAQAVLAVLAGSRPRYLVNQEVLGHSRVALSEQESADIQ